ncbi:substrate-binding domain-containing protein [Streptomyces atratus]|nr:substrate-binding domain-containing protein [Streptomyces atratus]
MTALQSRFEARTIRATISSAVRRGGRARNASRATARPWRRPGCRCPVKLVAWTGFTREGGRAGATTVLSAAERPDAVVCANDLIAIGALGTAWAAGLRVPHDVAITGYDDIEAASLVSPALTTVLNPAREIGRSAAQLLVDRLDGDGPGTAREIVLAHRLVPRESA